MPVESVPGQAPLGAPLIALIPAFLAIFARVGALVIFVPFPGYRNAAVVPRAILSLALSLILFSAWTPKSTSALLLEDAVWAIPQEMALGVSAGVVVSWLNEIFVSAMQLAGAQAGYSYAATIDPATQVDSAILQVFAQLTAGLLFFAAGLDRELIRAFAGSLTDYPPGSFSIQPGIAEAIIHWTASSLSLALRLSLPLIALLALVDLALALVGRVQAQLQMLSLAFPAKTLFGLVLLGILWRMMPTVYESAARTALELVVQIVTRSGAR